MLGKIKIKSVFIYVQNLCILNLVELYIFEYT